MLDIDRLCLSFSRYHGLARRREIACLSDVSLTLERGEVLAVIGGSGSGKSLLAHAVMGILPANALVRGEVRIDGRPLDAAGRLALCGSRMALVPQSISHLDPLVRSGRQIAWAARRAGRARGAIPALVAGELARFRLGPEAARAFPHELSGGMARRVLLAIATAGSADLLIADEPTSGLDAANAGVVLAHLRRLAGEGRAVMLITHDLAGALRFADRVAIIRDGALSAIAPAADFTGDGEALASPYARALWRALPQNDFIQNDFARHDFARHDVAGPAAAHA